MKWKYINCVCGSNRNLKIYNKDRYGILSPVCICFNCGTLRSNPVPSNEVINKFYSDNLYQKIYSSLDIEAHFHERIKVRKDFKNSIFLKCTEPFLTKGKSSKIIEIGCGGGWNLDVFKRAGYTNLVGYEPGAITRNLGIRELGLDLREGFIDDVCESGEKYDLIMLHHVIEHLIAPINVLKKLKNLLTDEGVLYLALPNIQHLSHSQIQNAHYWYFSPLFFMKLLISSGYLICDYGKQNKKSYYYISVKNKNNFKNLPFNDLIKYERNIIFAKLIPSFLIDIFEKSICSIKNFLRPLKIFLINKFKKKRYLDYGFITRKNFLVDFLFNKKREF